MLEKTLRAFEDFKERIDLKFELSDETDEQHLLIENYRIQEFEKLNRIFENEYNEYVVTGVCFYGCPIEIYKNAFESRLEEYLKNSKDELALINDELSEGVFYNPYSFLDNHFKRVIETALRQRQKFIDERLKNLGYTFTSELNEQNETFEIVLLNKGNETEKKFPDYCLVGALFAQGFVFKDDTDRYMPKYCYKDVCFSNVNKLSDYIKREIFGEEISIRQYLNDTLRGSDTQKNFFKCKDKMKNILDYCELHKLPIANDFQSKYNSLNT